MKIAAGEVINIWLAGNTGLRNPLRIYDGFAVFSKSPFVGKLHGQKNEIDFTSFLNAQGIIVNQNGRDTSGSHGRKWRLMFERFGLIYGKVQKKYGFSQKDFGPVDEITPFGRDFLHADTIPARQEFFLRASSVAQYEIPERKGFFSPLRWILAIMLELESRKEDSSLSRLEFGLWGHTTNPSYDVHQVADRILDLRRRRKNAAVKSQFDRKEISERAKYYSRKSDNFLDYADMNMRYLRISGILQRHGRGIAIVPSKHTIAQKLASAAVYEGPLLDELIHLTEGAPIPSDNLKVAKAVLKELTLSADKKNILYDLSDLDLNSAKQVNIAIHRIELLLFQTNEFAYAENQRNQWQEISDYMQLLERGGGKKSYGDDYEIEISKEEAAAYLEWTLWRAVLAIDHMINAPYTVRGFAIDSEFFPVSTASGGRADLYCEFENYIIVAEVTLSSSSRQEAMEGEPVRRHIADAVLSCDKPVYGLFVAGKVDINTAETFRHGIWYHSDGKCERLKIVPLSLAQFRKFFTAMFQGNRTNPDRVIELMDDCIKERDSCNAPEWQNYIEKAVKRMSGN